MTQAGSSLDSKVERSWQSAMTVSGAAGHQLASCMGRGHIRDEARQMHTEPRESG